MPKILVLRQEEPSHQIENRLMSKFLSIGYSFFEELEGCILPPMQLTFEIELNPDAELLFGNVDTTRVTIDRFYLWVPKVLPKDSLMTKYITEFQKPSRY